MRSPRIPLIAALLFAVGCSTTTPRTALDVSVTEGESAPDTDAFVARFFADGPSEPGFAAELDANLRRHPTSGSLREAAGYWFLLQGNDHAAWENFLRAAADTRNPGAALDLYELGRIALTRSEIDASVDVLGRIAQTHPDAAARARAAMLAASYLRTLGRDDEAAAALAPLGFIQSVEMIGAFDNEEGKGFAEVYPPESRVDLGAEVPGAIEKVRWRRLDALPWVATFPLVDTIYPTQQAVAYVAVWVKAPADTPAVLRLSTDGAVAAWVDHAPVAREDRIRHFGLDNVNAPFVLRHGYSEILVKSAVKSGPWHVALRITDPEGKSIPGLVTALSPPADGTQAPPPSSTAPAPSPPGGAHAPREAFANARTLVARGLCQPGLSSLEKLLARSPDDALLRYFTADAAAQDHQTERALDLLTAGITATSALPAFLRARAEIYVQKELWSQSQRDLARAIELQPAARQARSNLADVFGRRGWETDRVRALEDVLARWPDWEAAYMGLGGAREAQGHRALAEEAYRHALALEPGARYALDALLKLAERHDDGSAGALFERVAALDPLDVGNRIGWANFEREQGHLREADARLAALSVQSPDHPTPYLRRAQIAEESGRTADAVAFYRAAQERDPRDSWLAERLEHLQPAATDLLRAYVPDDDAIEAALKKPSARADPASHIEVLLYEEATLLNPDGSSRAMHTEVMRSLSQHGRDEMVRIGLPMQGQVRVLKAFAQTPEGQRQEASSVDRTSVRFRNLEVGSTVVLQYAHYPRRGGALWDDYFSDWTFSWGGRHIDSMRWVVVAPKSKQLFLDVDPRIVHTETDVPAAAGEGAWVAHQFSRKNVAALPAEPGMVPFADVQAHAVVTTMPSWDAFIRWEKAILDESFPADPAIDALAGRLTDGATTPRDKLGKLFAFVAQEIRYQQEYESILAGWQPHRSAVVLERKYGDCKDKATLLIALGRAVGLKLEFAVLATHHLGHPDRKVALPTFNHAIVYVPAQAGIEAAFFVDPTVDALDLWNLREDDQGASALVLDPTTGHFTWVDVPYQSPDFKIARWKAEVVIDAPDQVRATSHLEMRGGHASSLRTALRSEDQSRQVYDYIASQMFPGAKILKASAPDHESLLHPLAIDQEIDASAAIRQEGDHYRLNFPNDAESTQTKLAERQTPLDLGAPSSQKSEIVVRLGDGVRLVEKPAPVDVVDPCFHVRREVSGDKTRVVVQEDFQQTCTTVSVADYPRYRAAMEKARGLLDSALVFEKASAKANGKAIARAK